MLVVRVRALNQTTLAQYKVGKLAMGPRGRVVRAVPVGAGTDELSDVRGGRAPWR